MKARTQVEFEASIRQGVSAANSLKDSGWLPATEGHKIWRGTTDELLFLVDGTAKVHESDSGDDFKPEPS